MEVIEFAAVQRKIAYLCLLGAGGCLGAWLGGGAAAFATTGLILLVVAGTSWVAAVVWERRGR